MKNYDKHILIKPSKFLLSSDNDKSNTFWRVIKVNEYDRLGRLKAERMPGAAGGHTLEYSYNTRGQVTGMEGDLFRQTLYYTSNPFDGPLSFSGNLSASEVSSLDMANGTPLLSMRKTSYTYDALDRITEAADYSGGTDGYTPIEEYYRYDRNGNAVSVRREYGGSHWDAVQIVYRGNRIMRLTSAIKDAGYLGKLPKMPFYAKSYPIDPVHYDAVGRLTSDDTRGIDTLKYVYGLARPSEVRFANGSRMINAFRADGTKVSEGIKLRYLETVETTAGTGQEGGGYKSHSISRSFYGPIVSEFETTGRTTMYRIYNDAGYVLYDPKTGTGEYRYYIRDHLGNVRVEIDGDGNVIRAADYTVSGIPIEKSWLTYPGPECYAGLAYYDELGNGWYDNNARLMESLMMRFTAMDPLCEKYPAISPYANCLCNPLRFSDNDGKAVKPAGTAELIMIQNTLPKEDRKYVQLDDMGFINKSLINSHLSKSGNYNDLVQMVNDQRFIINATLTNEYTYMDNQGNLHRSQMGYGEADSYFADPEFKNASGITTGETGKLGVTLLPGKGESGVNSTSKDEISIYINTKLSTVGKAETFSHEGYGHTIMYLNTLDRTKSGHIIRGNRDMNIELLNRIIKSRKETIKNIINK